jgi:uncharacterized protein DUF6544
MRYAIAAFLLAHGIAHLPGFAVPWRLLSSPEMPYSTTLLSGRWDVGAAGIRFIGLAWLVTGLTFVAAAIGYARNSPWAVILIAAVAMASLVLSVVNWPLARIGVFLNVGVLAMLPLIGQLAWRDGSAARVEALLATADRRSLETFDIACLKSVPPPVARFLSRSLTAGQPLIDTLRVEQTGEFRVGESWQRFQATQRFSVEPAGFVWDARIAMMPLLPVLVRDSYVAGSAAMRGEIGGVYPIVNQSQRRELDAGALQRFLAEAVWFPTALLPRESLKWTPIDDHRARATLTDKHTTVSLEFRFNDAGEATEIFAPDRYAENHGRYEPKPWIVRCSEYETHAGMRIPVQCEVAWIEPTGPAPYWRGRVVGVTSNSELRIQN